MIDIHKLTISEVVNALNNKEYTCVELTQAFLENISNLDDEINAFITVDQDLALTQARHADEMYAAGKARLLEGVPFSVKDAICTEDIRSTGAGLILDNYVSPFEATVITKLREQGAILIGKNNCDTFGHGASNENSMYGPVRNPYNVDYVAGGSSGGSAAAVAADMSVFSIAEDTGGSIRQPASFCGLAGLRPSYGRNSRYGIMPMASSLDTVGPMANSVADIALLLEIMAGSDQKDATSVPNDVPKYTQAIKQDVTGLKVGIPKEYFDVDALEPEVLDAVNKQIEKLKTLGCEILPVSLPHTKYAIPVYYLLVPSEDSSNMARLDGIRYGVQHIGKNLEETYSDTRSAGFPHEVKRRIMIGTYALSAGYYDAYYKKAQKVRTMICRDFDEVFKEVDVLVTPTSPFPAFKLNEKKEDVLAMYAADIFVSPAAVAGVPALSINAGVSDEGLPIGLQIIGKRLDEEMVLRVGHNLETK